MDQHSANRKGSFQWVSCYHHKGKTTPHHHYAYICSCLVSDPYHTILMVVLCTCQLSHSTRSSFTTQNSTRKEQQTSIRLTVQHIKHTLWLPTMEVQAVPWTEVWISSQMTQNMLIPTMTAPIAADKTVSLGGPEAVGYPEDTWYMIIKTD